MQAANHLKNKVAIGIPCLNEASTINSLVKECQLIFPQARVIVFDNNSSDQTKENALLAGAEVIKIEKKGKGHVIQYFLKNIEADTYVLLDGDGTYPVTEMKKLFDYHLSAQPSWDMILANRMIHFEKNAFSFSHKLGNKLISFLISKLFNVPRMDVLSGGRIINRSLAQALNLKFGGFETETEMTIKSIKLNRRITQVPIYYKSREQGSYSKIKTMQDGLKILKTLVHLIVKQ